MPCQHHPRSSPWDWAAAVVGQSPIRIPDADGNLQLWCVPESWVGAVVGALQKLSGHGVCGMIAKLIPLLVPFSLVEARYFLTFWYVHCWLVQTHIYFLKECLPVMSPPSSNTAFSIPGVGYPYLPASSSAFTYNRPGLECCFRIPSRFRSRSMANMCAELDISNLAHRSGLLEPLILLDGLDLHQPLAN